MDLNKRNSLEGENPPLTIYPNPRRYWWEDNEWGFVYSEFNIIWDVTTKDLEIKTGLCCSWDTGNSHEQRQSWRQGKVPCWRD